MKPEYLSKSDIMSENLFKFYFDCIINIAFLSCRENPFNLINRSSVPMTT